MVAMHMCKKDKKDSRIAELEGQLADARQDREEFVRVVVRRNERIGELLARIAELEAKYEPKPVVQVEYFNIYLFAGKPAWSQVGKDNLKLTFEDGKPVKAEVIG